MKRMRFGIAAMRFALVFSVLLCGAMNRAHADVLIASDSYATGGNPAAGQYVAGTSIASQTGLVTTGFATGGYTAGSVNTSNFISSSTGLTNAADGANASTGSVAWIATSSSDTATKSLAHNLTSIINESSSTTYWVSELMKNTGNQTTTTGSILSGFANATSTTLGTGTAFLQGVYFGFADNSGAANEADLVARYRDTSGGKVVAQSVLVNGANNATADTTYLVVAKITINSGLTSDTVNYWINPTDLSSQAALTSTALTTGTLNTLSYQGGSTGDFTRLNYVETNWDGGAFFDEARLGTTLASIAPAPVPEPSSVILLGAGSIVGLVVRSRRRALRAA
jgi:hypothetical protein